MAYSTVADLRVAVGGDEKYRQLTDLNNTGAADDAVGTAAIVEADGLIDSYAHKRFQVPFASPSQIVASLSLRLAAWNLRRGKPGSAISTEEIALHELDMKWLEALGRGDVSPGVDPSPAGGDMNVDDAGERDTAKSISREKFRGFW